MRTLGVEFYTYHDRFLYGDQIINDYIFLFKPYNILLDHTEMGYRGLRKFQNIENKKFRESFIYPDTTIATHKHS